MKFTLSWLKDHLDTTASVDEIAEALTDLGLEVEGIENPLAVLEGFTLDKVKKAEQHPDADRLRVCVVETDEGDKQIICGAPNARAGITVVVCKPGDYVPGIDLTLSVGAILIFFSPLVFVLVSRDGPGAMHGALPGLLDGRLEKPVSPAKLAAAIGGIA